MKNKIKSTVIIVSESDLLAAKIKSAEVIFLGLFGLIVVLSALFW